MIIIDVPREFGLSLVSVMSNVLHDRKYAFRPSRLDFSLSQSHFNKREEGFEDCMRSVGDVLLTCYIIDLFFEISRLFPVGPQTNLFSIRR